MAPGRELLGELASRFENDAQAPPELTTASGWGQFLDAPKRHEQTGPYGTSSGLIVLALAERGRSSLLTQAQSLLEHWWRQYRAGEDGASKRFVQTLRLAFLNLALQLSSPVSPVSVTQEISQALLDRLLPSGLWGDWWISRALYDQTPRMFPSAIALLSFSLFRDASTPLDASLIAVADRLEARLRGSTSLTPLETASMACAVLSVKGASIDWRTSRRMIWMARSIRADLGGRFPYFYDFEYSPVDGQTRFGRDYFLVPRELLIGLCGFQMGAPSELRLRAEGILASVGKNMRSNNGAYRPDAGDRLSSLEQGWAALLLKASLLEHVVPGRSARLQYWLFRQRPDNMWTEVVIPVFSMIGVTAASAVLEDSGPLLRTVAALAALAVGGVYGRKPIRRLIRGYR